METHHPAGLLETFQAMPDTIKFLTVLAPQLLYVATLLAVLHHARMDRHLERRDALDREKWLTEWRWLVEKNGERALGRGGPLRLADLQAAWRQPDTEPS